MVDLFAAYDVALAPFPANHGASFDAVPEVTIAMAFASPQKPGERGRVTLSFPAALLDQMQGAANSPIKQDWARELTNQLVGRIKNRLIPYGFLLDVGALTHVDQKSLEYELNDPKELRIYAARSMQGLVLATIKGMPKDSELAYLGQAPATEGSVIWF